MEPDHYIRSIEVTLDKDPVPWKGKFNFTPGNGRAWVAFTMRSGTGGLVRAVVECSKHGTLHRDARGPGRRGRLRHRRRAGGPRPHRQPAAPAARLRCAPGQIVEARTKVDHDSHTGLTLKGGKMRARAARVLREGPARLLDGEKISEFQMGSAISANPLIRFPLKITKSGTVRVVFVNSEGQRWEASQPVRV